MAKMKAKATRSKRRGRRTRADTWRLKKWYEIKASPEFEHIYICQTPASDESRLYGRVIETSLYDFTQDFNHIYIKIRFKIIEVNGLICTTMFIGHELTRDFVRSLVRRGSNKIDGIIDVKTKDGYVFRVTGAVFTKGLAKSSQQKTIRKIMFDIIQEKAKNLNFKEFVQEIVFGMIEKDIRRISKEIYPIRECRLLKTKLIKLPSEK
ncbi:MAG: 30S ribosomal protein S3ae [Promethearchaeota archaeon]